MSVIHTSCSAITVVILLAVVALIRGEIGGNFNLHRYELPTLANETEFITSIISGNERIVLEKHKSPYLVRKDIVIEKDGELVIERGVTVLFSPTVGITVKGILMAEVIIICFF